MNSREMLAMLDQYGTISEDCYWIHDCSDYDYCYACVQKAAIVYYKVPELVVMLGWEAVLVYVEQEHNETCLFGIGCGDESDSCRHCETCGVLLDYTLTDYGVDSELESFRGRRLSTPLNKGDAHHIARILAAKQDDPVVLRLARRAIAKIPKGT